MQRFRHGLATALTATALPYGYSLAVWSSGELVSHAHRPPNTVDVILFVAGAAAGFGLLRLSVGDIEEQAAGIGRGHVIRAGTIHVVGIMGATGAAAAIAQVSVPAAWALVSFCSTIVYLGVVAVEQAFELQEHH